MSELAIWHQGRNLLAGYEGDPGFKEVVLRHNVVGMRSTGVLAIGIVVAFLAGSWIMGKEFVLLPIGDYTPQHVALLDKLFIAVVGAGVVTLSSSRAASRRGRLIVGVLTVAIIVAMVFDDAARADADLSPMYVTIALIVAVGAMPFRLVQALALCTMAIASCFATVRLGPTLIGNPPADLTAADLLVLILVGSVLSAVSLFLYNVRYQQYRVQRNMRLLKERVERQAASLRMKNQLGAIEVRALRDRGSTGYEWEARWVGWPDPVGEYRVHLLAREGLPELYETVECHSRPRSSP